MRKSKAEKIETIDLVEDVESHKGGAGDIDWDDIEEVFEQVKSGKERGNRSPITEFIESIHGDNSDYFTCSVVAPPLKDASNATNQSQKTTNEEPKITKFCFFKDQARSLTDFFAQKKQKKESDRRLPAMSPGKRTVSVLKRASSKKKYTYSDEKIPVNKVTQIPDNKGNKPGTAFSLSTGNNWFYLGAKNFRRYQFEIVESALFYNTLVCLPTGLGKTYIATNVMFNYYKWFPRGKIFFLAPTKPLVTQQLASLETVKGIDFDEVCEVTGILSSKKREKCYDDKRIFFMTPQTLENDLNEQRLDLSSIVLIIYGKLTR